MKKNIFLFVAITIICYSCGNSSVSTAAMSEVADSAQTDTLAMYMQKLDSINNSGKLRHLNIYKLGKMKSIEFQVVSIESESDTVEYINLRKDCGGEYYYDWENASLLAEEVKFFVTAIDTIAANFDKTVANEERYVYITRDDIRLFSANETAGSGKWSADLSVDYHKKNSYININKDDFSALKTLLLKGEQKIKEIRKR
ncbi:MAG: hypothetical protein IJJ56_06950 [Prevotella sp.]|nr:hypothetical protein [Prevotella sp.]